MEFWDLSAYKFMSFYNSFVVSIAHATLSHIELLTLTHPQRGNKRLLRNAHIAILTAGRLTAPRIRMRE
jgi:hypothetical protein